VNSKESLGSSFVQERIVAPSLERVIFYLLFTIYDLLDPVHRIKEIFPLRVDTNAEFFSLASQSLL
jgi:hypothetical protein